MEHFLIFLAILTMAAGSPSARIPRQASNAGDFQTEPRRAVVRPLESVTLLGNAGVPLQKCHFYLPVPGGKFLDFSHGPNSSSTDRYEYFGRGLDSGECGIRFKSAQDDDDGLVECRVKMETSNKWEKCVTTLRVTEVSVAELPVFNIEPKAANLHDGDNLTVTCNADRPINMCHIYLPGPKYLNFDHGVQSERTSEYQYLGTGLKDGHCGVTLTGVDSKLNGYIVCKIGQWPEQVTGAWETDALKVVTSRDFQTEPRRALVRPGESVTLLGNAGVPLQKCHFYLPVPGGKFLDFSHGPNSSSTDRYEYFGRGLDSGECGIRFKMAEDEDDGIVECKVKPNASKKWMKCVTTLRVTEVSVVELPMFEIEPKDANLRHGDNLTVTCNADRPINMCHIYLPGPRYLNFDRGVQSERTSEYQYLGTGLKDGHCGVTLTGVNSRLNGYIVCKLGQWPEQVTGAWETDALKVATSNAPPPNSTIPHHTVHFPNPTTRPTTTEAPNREPCGRVKLSPTALITNGLQTEQGQWPWHVALYKNVGSDLTYICGGSLISKTAVVTAAHCVVKKPSNRPLNPDSIVLYFGKYHRLLWSEGGVQTKQLEQINIHPTYNATNLQGDIAILILISAVDYTDYVRPVCLWDKTNTGLDKVVGKQGTIVGWGYDHTSSPTRELMMAKMPVVDQQTCIWSYPDFFSQFTSNRTLCAGIRNGTSACNGDSGGGLVFPIEQSDKTVVWHIRGLVSLSVPKAATRVCDPSYYTVFTDVAKYLPWVEQHAGKLDQ